MTPSTVRSTQSHAVPHINQPMVGWFRWFVRRYLRKNFHAVACNASRLPLDEFSPDDTLIIYANHASWWDPLTAIRFHDQYFCKRAMYAPIDAEALQKYRMFSKLGFYPVAQQPRELRQFLHTTDAIVDRGNAAIWITPEGRFTDARDTEQPLEPGLGHLATRYAQSPPKAQRVWFLPAAVEYVFWEERLPELLGWFGKPVCCSEFSRLSRGETTQRLTFGLRAAQAELASASIQRDTAAFQLISHSDSGSFFVYDWLRRAKSKFRNQPFDVQHGQLWSEDS